MHKNKNIAIGSVLVADPLMPDTNFKETVVLLTDAEDDGIYGFTINKKMALQLHEIVDDITEKNIDVFYGGPVGLNTLQFIHNAPAVFTDAKKIMEGLYLGGSFDILVQKINNNQLPPSQYKIFMGYCGWDVEQLIAELYDEESWLKANLTVAYVLQQNTIKMYEQCKSLALLCKN